MIDLDELEVELRAAEPRQRLYEIVKAEMKRRGRWKNKPRGNPMSPGADTRRHTL